MTRHLLYILLLTTVVLTSCSQGKTQGAEVEGDTLRLKYSRLLTVVDYGKYRTVDIADPWREDRTLHRYILVSDTTANHLPEGTIINVPIHRAMVFTTVHASLLADLGAMKAICGMADVRYVKRQDVRRMVADKIITDLGNSMSPDIEKIIDGNPDMVLVSPFENSGGYGKLDELHIPIVECADYMEPSPLARAEWMKLYGMLTGHEDEANALFEQVETRYNSLKTEASQLKDKPKVVIDLPIGNTWYVPGGQSTIGQMVEDAGGTYCFRNDKSGGSKALAAEVVVEQCEDADLWLFRYGGAEKTIATLASENKAFTHLKAWQDGNVWGCSTERTLFYEETPFRPDRLLEEFSNIFRNRSGEGQYFKKLK